MSPSKPTDPGRSGEHPPSLEYERRFWRHDILEVAGVDEVGRGPLAGPVVAAAVILRPEQPIVGAADSKTLSPEVREALYDEIVTKSLAIAVGAASVREIDNHNILTATTWAMDRALRALRPGPRHIVVDGLPVKGLEWEHDAVVGGDTHVHSIACASIVAKVSRDRLMKKLARKYARYRWDTNMGYGTPDHLKALREWGPSPHHRLTFRPSQMELEFDT